MPSLTELIAQQVDHARDNDCPRCGTRKAAIYVRAQAVRRLSQDPQALVSRSANSKTMRTVKSTRGVKLCRACASEVIDQIAQLLGTGVHDGEAD
jgi:hypothetical protein